MIRRLQINNLTVFQNARLSPARGLNVIVGENGTGKTHLLKLMYSMVSVLGRDRKAHAPSPPTKAALQGALADKLVNVFRPETLGRLARRRQGRERCDISVSFNGNKQLTFGFATNSKTDVQIVDLPNDWLDDTAAYLPTRELLTIYPNFVSIYESLYLEFEETWRDTCIALGAPLARGPKESSIRSLLDPLEEAMGGSIILDKSGRFYLQASSGRMEIPLVAEGLRKLGMVARLIATGRLVGNGYLFWDEPEANLNPRLIKGIARTILDLSASGIQVFIATHSLFLLREIEIISSENEHDNRYSIKYFGLSSSDNGVTISGGESLADINIIASLDEELQQADRLLEID